MKKKLLMIVLMLLSFCSCEVTQGNFNEKEPLVFSPSKTLDYNIDYLKEMFINSEFYDEEEYTLEFEIGNYTSKEYSDKYDFDLFYVKNKNSEYKYKFVRYKNELYECSFSKYDINSVALSDLNDDGFFEVSFTNKAYEIGHNDYLNGVESFDTYTRQHGFTRIKYNDILLLKKGNDNDILIYGSKDNILDDKDVLLDSIIENNRKITIKNSKCHLKSESIEVICTFTNKLKEFPLCFKNSYSIGKGYGEIEVDLTVKWLKENTTFIDGDNVLERYIEFFNNNESYRYQLSDGVIEKDTAFVIEKDQEFYSNYSVYPYSFKEGTYNLKIYTDFDEEGIVVENFLKIKDNK